MRPTQLDMFRPLTVDFFAGGGGTSEGLRLAGRHVDHAVDHWPVALAIHEANHPNTIHHIESVWKVKPIPGTEFFWQSPDCTHHSRCKGGKPRSNKLRGLAWVGTRWAKEVGPRIVATENVPELVEWGPCLANGQPDPKRKGKTFRAWVRKFESYGYHVAWKQLRACDFGAPTSRKRLFVIARKDAPPVWPTPTHGPGRLPFRTARECIDWNVLPPSIFGRKPYSLATQKRIARGLKKFGSPCLIQLSQGERVGQEPRIFDADNPLTTVVASGVKHGVVVVYVAKHFGGNGTAGSSLDAPLGTITTKDHNSLVVVYRDSTDERRAECRAWLDKFVGVGFLPEAGDIGMRPFTPRELARAQGLPDSYVIDPVVNGKRIGVTAQVRAIGNMVPPCFSRAIAEANEVQDMREAAE